MTQERIILCGGAPRDRGSTTPIVKLNTSGQDKNIRLELTDVSDAMVADLPPVLADLLEVAAYVYCADQVVPRGGTASFDYGERWRRTLRFRIPVRRPEVWSQTGVLDALSETLGFMSDDTYEFAFEKARRPAPVKEYIDFDEETVHVKDLDAVCLFSGGLDSLAGAVEQIVTEQRRVALVSHRSAPVLDNRQKRQVPLLAERAAEGGAPFHVSVWVHKKDLRPRDDTQRTRSFLYASLATTVARMFGLDRIRFHENGPVSLNLPLCSQVVGARATRTTHPRVLNGFSKLFSLLLDTEFTVENPFFWKTRADLVAGIKAAGCADLIRHTVSCTHTHGATRLHRHCGRCSQCIDRRFATLAAGCDEHDPREAYEVDLFTGQRAKTEDRTMIERYVAQATAIEGIEDAEAFLERFPELVDVLPYIDGRTDRTAQAIFDTSRRQAKQVCAVVDQAIRDHATEMREGSLPDTCLLRLLPPGGRTGVPGGKRKKKGKHPRRSRAEMALADKAYLIGAFLTHHKFDSDEPNYEWATQVALGKLLNWPQCKVSRAARTHFGPDFFKRYRAAHTNEQLTGFIQKLDDSTIEVEVPSYHPLQPTQREADKAQNQ